MLDVFFDKWWRVGGVAGILYLVMFIIGIILQGGPPNFDDPVDEIQGWFTDNGKQYIAGNYLIGLGFVLFFLPFLSSLRGLLAAAEGGAAVWSRVAFAAGLAFLILGAAASSFQGALAFGLGVVEEGDEATIRTLMYLDYYAFSGTLPLVVTPLFLASSLVILRTGVLWRWLAVLGLVVAIGALIGGLTPLDSDSEGIAFISFIAIAAWVLLVSIAMIMKRDAPASAA